MPKVAREAKLTPGDWDVLLRFFAASLSRTPAHFFRQQPIWNRDLPAHIEKVLKNTVEGLRAGPSGAS